MTHSIINNISRHISLKKIEQEAFINSLEFKMIPKKTTLLREGNICNFELYIQKGCIRSYFITDDGHDVTLQFGVEDWWAGNIASFYENMPAHIFMETLEDSEVYYLYSDKKEDLLNKFPIFEKAFRIMVQKHLVALEKRIIQANTFSATEKYEDFLKKFPNIPNRVPQYYIASYLGISTEFISKIRKSKSINPS